MMIVSLIGVPDADALAVYAVYGLSDTMSLGSSL